MSFTSFARPLGLAAVLAVLSFSLWQGAQTQGQTGGPKPPPLTAAQKEKLQERDRLIPQIRKAENQGKLAEAARLLEEKIVLERAIFGSIQEEVARSLNELGAVQEARGDFKAARQARKEVLATCTSLYGAKHWKAVDARWTLADVETLARMTPAERAQVALARRLDREGVVLLSSGKLAEAEKVLGKSLTIRKKFLGHEHPAVATSATNLALALHRQSRYEAAEKLNLQALTLRLNLWGKEHPATALSYNNLAANLREQGRYAAAEAMDLQALAVFLKVRGKEYPATALSYNNLAADLSGQGRYEAAEKLDRLALAIYLKVRDENHPDIALSYNNLARDLSQQRRYEAAKKMDLQALAIYLKVRGEEHPDTARSYSNLALDLRDLGQYAEAEKLDRSVLDLRLQMWGEEHPDTARSYNNLAVDLYEQRQYPAAAELARQALAVEVKVRGNDHPATALGYTNLASLYYVQGEYQKAEEMFRAGAKSFQVARLRVSFTGLGRSRFTAERSPSLFLAALLARNGKAAEAWKYFEDDLGRGLFDDLSARTARLLPEERQTEEALQSQLALLDKRLPDLLAGKRKYPALAAELRTERDRLLLQLVQSQAAMEAKYGPAVGKVYGLAEIQSRLAPDSALVGWVDLPARPNAKDPNEEHWAVVVRRQGPPAWVKLRGTGPGGAWAERDDKLPGEARQQLHRPDPTFDWEGLQADLARQRLRPLQVYLGGVKHLIILPSSAMAGIPVEALTDRYLVSYAHSGTLYAWLQEQRKPAPEGPGDLLALADPDFSGKGTKLALAGKGDPLTRLLRGESLKPLPGTRGEVEAVARLFRAQGAQVTKFLGAQANGANLDRLAFAKGLSRYRYLHLATHGEADPDGGLNSFLALTPGDASVSSYAKLTAGHILRTWKLKADLVTLSACQTGLGELRGGEGYVGFSQALFLAGAQTLVLSQWEADDAATTLLMQRFYQNLLGQRQGLKAPLAKAQALAEAKRWLRGLGRDEALQRLKGLGVEVEVRKLAGDRPYAHPHFWAPFILVGDPGTTPGRGR